MTASVQPALRASHSVLKGLIGAFEHLEKRAQRNTQIEELWREMNAMGDLLIDALRIEREFRKMDFTQPEEGVPHRWKLQRDTVERLAVQYAVTVETWREALRAECLLHTDRLYRAQRHQ